MATEYPVELKISLTPKYINTVPWVTVSVPGQQQQFSLDQPQTLALNFCSTQGFVSVEFHNKNYNEPVPGRDMAVIVDSVEFFGIADPKFVWAGKYIPNYPEPWFGQQQPKPASVLSGHSYLGWNGIWRLDFDVPVFSWMHQTLGLGWLYR